MADDFNFERDWSNPLPDTISGGYDYGSPTPPSFVEAPSYAPTPMDFVGPAEPSSYLDYAAVDPVNASRGGDFYDEQPLFPKQPFEMSRQELIDYQAKMPRTIYDERQAFAREQGLGPLPAYAELGTTLRNVLYEEAATRLKIRDLDPYRTSYDTRYGNVMYPGLAGLSYSLEAEAPGRTALAYRIDLMRSGAERQQAIRLEEDRATILRGGTPIDYPAQAREAADLAEHESMKALPMTDIEKSAEQLKTPPGQEAPGPEGDKGPKAVDFAKLQNLNQDDFRTEFQKMGPKEQAAYIEHQRTEGVKELDANPEWVKNPELLNTRLTGRLGNMPSDALIYIGKEANTRAGSAIVSQVRSELQTPLRDDKTLDIKALDKMPAAQLKSLLDNYANKIQATNNPSAKAALEAEASEIRRVAYREVSIDNLSSQIRTKFDKDAREYAPGLERVFKTAKGQAEYENALSRAVEDTVTSLTMDGSLTKADMGKVNMMIRSQASRFADAMERRASAVTPGPFENTYAWGGQHASLNLQNWTMLLAAGLGAYGALIAQPQAAKQNYQFQEKMAKRAEKYNIEMFNRQAGFARSGGGGGGSGRGTPSKAAEVRLGV